MNDRNRTWRLFYSLDDDGIVILEVDEKKTRKTAKATKEVCQNENL
jgi:phage-related protein